MLWFDNVVSQNKKACACLSIYLSIHRPAPGSSMIFQRVSIIGFLLLMPDCFLRLQTMWRKDDEV